MPKPLLHAVLAAAMALCSAQALAGEANAGAVGVITGGGQGGDGVKDKSNYYYVYLGTYYDTPRFAGPLSWRFSAMAQAYAGLWFHPGFPGQKFLARDLRVLTGPSLVLPLPNGWWLWDGLQAGIDWEDRGPGYPLLMIQNELMFGLGFFSSYWNVQARLTPDDGLEMGHVKGQFFFRMAPWIAFGPQLRFQTSAPSLGLLVQVSENRPQQRWNATAGFTFDDTVGGQWHLDLWFGF